MHAVDVSNGIVVVENIQQVWPNSCVAIDNECYKVLIVGDDGKAAMYDIRMGAPHSTDPLNETLSKIPLDTSSILEPNYRPKPKRVPLFKTTPG